MREALKMKPVVQVEVGITSSTTPNGVIRHIMNQMIGYVNHVMNIKTTLEFNPAIPVGELKASEDAMVHRIVLARIMLNPYLEGRCLDQLIVVAHEIGHIEDIVTNYEGSLQEFIKDREVTPDDITTRIATEHRAWGYAIRLLKCYGFKEWDRFLDIVDDSFTSYFAQGHSHYTFEHCRALLVEEINKAK